jgi:predicted ATPase
MVSEVAALCAELDGLPLAIELAASRVRVMSVAEIARRLSDRFGLLRGGSRDAPQRHRTLHAVVDWSWNLLDEAGGTAMRLPSVFPGGFTADAANRLLGSAGEHARLHHPVSSRSEPSDTGTHRLAFPRRALGHAHITCRVPVTRSCFRTS